MTSSPPPKATRLRPQQAYAFLSLSLHRAAPRREAAIHPATSRSSLAVFTLLLQAPPSPWLLWPTEFLYFWFWPPPSPWLLRSGTSVVCFNESLHTLHVSM
ncbi:hypothetical protein PVAP13_8KG367502 [Panicum virgatum]|uniref:Uncharacterized protein n=1 Tax=Panicum virgatum TaxID=38727 RepID=A0A8T0Q0B4_PANVG|nr:hypothetical protein PVAP13_8KG367502 [Panicum virgatum]